MEPEQRDETVRLTVPPTLEHLRLVRLTTAGVASRLGFDVEEIDDLRVAVDELAGLVLERARGPLEVTFTTVHGALRIAGEAPTGEPDATGPVSVDALTRQILAAVADDWDVDAGGGRARFCCVRRIPDRR